MVWRRGWWWVCALVVGVAGAGEARAERGALTFELSGGVDVLRAIGPGVTRPRETPLSTAPAAALSVLGSLHHDLEVGLFLAGRARRDQRIDELVIQERTGTYVERISAATIAGLLRISAFGLVSRAFLEIRPGLRYLRHDLRDHLKPPETPGASFQSYALELSPESRWAPLLAVGLGWLRSGDRLGLGLRVSASLAVSRGVLLPGFGLQLFSSWSFYP